MLDARACSRASSSDATCATAVSDRGNVGSCSSERSTEGWALSTLCSRSQRSSRHTDVAIRYRKIRRAQHIAEFIEARKASVSAIRCSAPATRRYPVRRRPPSIAKRGLRARIAAAEYQRSIKPLRQRPFPQMALCRQFRHDNQHARARIPLEQRRAPLRRCLGFLRAALTARDANRSGPVNLIGKASALLLQPLTPGSGPIGANTRQQRDAPKVAGSRSASRQEDRPSTCSSRTRRLKCSTDCCSTARLACGRALERDAIVFEQPTARRTGSIIASGIST